MKGVRVRHRNRLARKKFPVTAARFREARLSCFLTVEACADLLRVSVRTVQNWESGAARPPYAAYKLMRVLRGGKLLGPEWRGFTIRADRLNTPEGHTFRAGDLAWWSLLVRQARAFALARCQLRELQDSVGRGGETDGKGSVTPRPAAGAAAPVDGRAARLVASGGRDCVKKNRLSVLPSSNRGVSETERDALEAVPPPCPDSAATLPKAGVAAQLRAGVLA